MRTRFPKVWCSRCRTMQFAGECPHAQRPPEMPSYLRQASSITAADSWGMELARFRARPELVLPPITGFREYANDGSGTFIQHFGSAAAHDVGQVGGVVHRADGDGLSAGGGAADGELPTTVDELEAR